MLTIGIVGSFAASLEDAIRWSLAIPCDIVVAGETEIVSRLPDIDVLVLNLVTA